MRILIISFSLILCLMSCNKDDGLHIDEAVVFKVTKNSDEWSATSAWANFSRKEQKVVVSGVLKDSEYYQSEHLRLSFRISDISKSNTVTQFTSEWNYIIGGDAVSDTYAIDASFNNLITISAIDTIDRRISGSFLVKLVRVPERSDQGEIFLFENGLFDLPLNVTD